MSILSEQKYLNETGMLVQWPGSQKEKLLVLAYLASKFELGRSYSEAEVNEILKQWHTFSDWPLLRRELVDRRFLERTRSGSEYRVYRLSTSNPSVELLVPSVQRDANVAVRWLEGEEGRTTLRLMGNTEAHNKPSTKEEEEERIRSFLTSDDQLTWTIACDRRTVGAVWVALEPTLYLPAPSIHIMIGDSTVRGRGIGVAVIETVIGHLQKHYSFERLHSRHLLENAGSRRLLARLGFKADGEEYVDSDGLRWQNVQLPLGHAPASDDRPNE